MNEELREAVELCKQCTSPLTPQWQLILDLATSVLNAEMPKEKCRDYAGGGNDKWMWEELRNEGYNQAIQESTLAHTRILLEKEEEIKLIEINLDGHIKNAKKYLEENIVLEQKISKHLFWMAEQGNSITELRDKIIDRDEQISKLQSEIAEARKLLEGFVDDEPCSYDHHGYCQAHAQCTDKCLNAEAKSFLEGR